MPYKFDPRNPRKKVAPLSSVGPDAGPPKIPPVTGGKVEWEEGRNPNTNPHGVREVRTPSGYINLAATIPTLILDLNERRRFAVITNAGNVPVYVHFRTPGADVAEGGIYLAASGGAVWFGLATDFPYTGPVTVYSGDNVEVAYMEN